MPPRKGTPAPIDQPLSRAYLREFKGWSTAYPPGISDPTSLRIMENVQITREGAARVRPALRSVFSQGLSTLGATMVGGFEHFYLNDGRKALLFAARLNNGRVGFRAAVYNETTGKYDIRSLTDSSVGFSIPQGEATLNFTSATKFVKYLQIDNKIFALSDAGEDLRLFFVGADKRARRVTPITVPEWDAADALTIRHPDAAWINGTKTSVPAAETPTTQTLISSTAADNVYSYGYFYTFENEVGETASSQVSTIKAARGWSQWRMVKPDSSGNPSTTDVTDPAKAMDQLVAILPEAVFTEAVAQGALRWNLYMFTWSDQDSIPVEGVCVGTRELSASSTYAKHGWIQNTAAVEIDAPTAIRPTEENRYNYSDPSSAGQGLVAGDRLVLVNDKQNGALIRWSSNRIGEYTNFSPSKGGGTKTLTSGNLLIPVNVKLWQNPQSVDTITILCSGTDGYSTSYYMAPASVDGASSSTQIMSFEETTATPGTVSPYGVEVLNNALYHPLDTELMKSTAANYNINHATLTDDIANKWVELRNKQWIVSSQHDNRLYYLVQNPDGAELEENCNGNEVWVYDAAKDAGTWSRWLVQGIALAKLQVGDKLYMAIARPEGIFVFDPLKITDDVPTTDGIEQRPIPWALETNTQGANRAHDAWCHLQQLDIVFGNLRGKVRYGIRGRDNNGQMVNVSKVYQRPLEDDLDDRPMPFDINDMLLVKRNLREWFFYVESVDDEPSYGQVDLVQYRYLPVSVNVGYAYGSVETFEYGDPGRPYMNNGIPEPFIDTDRP